MCENIYVYMYSMYIYNNVYLCVFMCVRACVRVGMCMMYIIIIQNVLTAKSIYIQLYNIFFRELFRRVSQMFIMNSFNVDMCLIS